MVIEELEQGAVSRMYPRNLFVYSAYWGSYSRVLQYLNGNPYQSQVEVSLTAINITSPLNWPRVASINIRKHGTSRGERDVYMKELPADALWHMRQWLDEPTIERLLHEDFLPHINWDLHHKYSNGGCPFDLCKNP